MIRHAYISALFVCMVLLSCTTSRKTKSTTYARTDSTHTSQAITNTTSKSDAVSAREIFFTANKVTEIDWIRDTTFRDTIIYVPRYRSYEATQHKETEQTRSSKADSTTQKIETKTELHKEEKTKDKFKQTTYPSLIFFIPLMGLLLLLIIFFFRKKIYNLIAPGLFPDQK